MGIDLKRSASPELIDSFYESLTALLRLYQFRDRNQIRMSGITASQAYVLDAVARLGPSWITRIGEELHLNKSTASRLVDSLEESGLVKRAADPGNHRASLIQLTPAGRSKYHQMVGLLKAEYASILADAPLEVVSQMVEVLENLTEAAKHRMEQIEERQ